MAESFKNHSMAPRQAVVDAVPDSAMSSSSPLFAAYFENYFTLSDTNPTPNTPQLPARTSSSFFTQQLQPPPSSGHPLTTIDSSYSFSFCSSDAFCVNGVTSNDAPQLSTQIMQDPQLRQQFVSSLTNTANTVTSGGSSNSNNNSANAPVSVTSGPFSGVTPPHPVSLSAANLEYLYGVPTPSAPSRAPYATSSASNCSSTHSYHSRHRQPSGSGESNYTTSSATYMSVDNNVPAPTATPGANGGADTSTGGDALSFRTGVQKDVLAFMAAEQQQQKFVLQQRNVYMSGLPVDFRPSAFRAMCEVFGRIESSKLCMEADDANRCRGFGFVLFYDVDSANSCITSLNGKVMQGKTLQVRRADLSAAPQPLNPVTQRNRTGSGLVTPPSLPHIGYSNSTNNSVNTNNNAMRSQSVRSGTPRPTTTTTTTEAYPIFNPHPSSANPNNAIPSSVVMSALPLAFATPTMVAHVHGSGNSDLTVRNGSATGSSFMYGVTSASSSLSNSATPTMVYPANTVVPAMRNVVPIMQMYTSAGVPAGSATMLSQQQPQQLVSYPSMSCSDNVTSHTATPPSVGSSNMNLAFVSGQQLAQQQQQLPLQPPSSSAQRPSQHQLPYQPQPSLHSPMRLQRPITTGANVAFYSTVDAQGTPIAGSGGPLMQPVSVHTPSMMMQEHLPASGVDPNASSSNIYYLFPK